MLSGRVAKLLLQFGGINSLQQDRELSSAAADDDALTVADFGHHASQHEGMCRGREAQKKQRKY